ncbi:hypothetical protein K474DRAFT_1580504, partial [Panus rudis PR-1116 ss-1]
MADVRALLKAKREEARVEHPLAAYSASGQLRCIACGIVVKQAAAWNGHVGSKTHRTNVARLKEDERQRQLTQQKRRQDDDAPASPDPKKRKLDPVSKEPSPPAGGFPADFFSDPSKAPVLGGGGDDDEEQEQEEQVNEEQSTEQKPAQTSIDLEWERFQQAVLNPPDPTEAFQRATIIAEPVLASEVPEGFPPRAEDAPEQVQEEELDEEQLRRKKEREDRELIMDRLLDEERAQEEADAKVLLLKNKLEALKRKREVAKAAK